MVFGHNLKTVENMQKTDSLLWEYRHLMQELKKCNNYFEKRKIEARMNVINALLGVPEHKSESLKDVICESKQKKNKF